MWRKNQYMLSFREGNGNYLLYNPITNFVVKVDEEALNLLNRKQGCTLEEKEVINTLKRHKFLVPENYNELREIESLEEFRKQREIRTKFSFFEFVITWKCNLNCKYCFQRPIKGVKKESLDLKKVKRIFEFIDGYSTSKKEISLTGGEPLLLENIKIISKILKGSKKRNIKIHITTNGTTLKEYSDLLLEYKKNIIIRVTVDGPKDIHNARRPFLNGKGSFDKIVESINLFLKKGFKKLHIITKFDSENIDYMGDTVKMFKKFGWLGKIRISFGVISNMGVNEEKNLFKKREKVTLKMLNFFKKNPYLVDFIEFDDESGSINIVKDLFFSGKLPEIKYFKCNAFRIQNSISFTPDGKIYPCSLLGMYDMYPIGNYINPDLNIDAIYQLKKRNILNLKKCHECKFLLICGGGCPFRDSIKGNIDIYNTTCLQKNLLENQISEFLFKLRKEKEMKQNE